MRFGPLALLVSLPLAGQVAEPANEAYKTQPGRAALARGLDAPDRDARQKPVELVAALDLKPGMVVADLGTGVGYLLPFLSRAVGASGRVIAQDIQDDFLEKARAKAEREKLGNVTFVKGTETDPNLPAAGVDVILALDAYHHFDYPKEMLAGIRRALRENGRFVIVDYYKRAGAMPGGDSLRHIRLDEDDVIKEVEAHGFRLVSRRVHLPGSQYMAIFSARPQPQEEQPALVFKTETSLALVRFHAVRRNKYVADLKPEDIHLTEDGRPQKIALFEGPGTGGRRTVPVEIILLFDVSLSVMNLGLLDTFAIKETFLDGLGAGTSVAVYAFGARMKRFSRPTRDIAQLREALEGVDRFTHGGTRLYEAIMETARDASRSGSNATRLMIVFSDGLSTTKTKPEAAVAVAKGYGIPLYPLVLGHERVARHAIGGGPVDPRRPESPGAMQRRANAQAKEDQMLEFASLGEATGGRSFDPPAVNSIIIRKIFQSLVAQVESEYVAGYYPASGGKAPQAHRVEVKLAAKDKGKIYGGVRTVVH